MPIEGEELGLAPRSGEAYATGCLLGVGLPTGNVVLEEHRLRYPDLEDCEVIALSAMVRRKSQALWLEGTPQPLSMGFVMTYWCAEDL